MRSRATCASNACAPASDTLASMAALLSAWPSIESRAALAAKVQASAACMPSACTPSCATLSISADWRDTRPAVSDARKACLSCVPLKASLRSLAVNAETAGSKSRVAVTSSAPASSGAREASCAVSASGTCVCGARRPVSRLIAESTTTFPLGSSRSVIAASLSTRRRISQLGSRSLASLSPRGPGACRESSAACSETVPASGASPLPSFWMLIVARACRRSIDSMTTFWRSRGSRAIAIRADAKPRNSASLSRAERLLAGRSSASVGKIDSPRSPFSCSVRPVCFLTAASISGLKRLTSTSAIATAAARATNAARAAAMTRRRRPAAVMDIYPLPHAGRARPSISVRANVKAASATHDSPFFPRARSGGARRRIPGACGQPVERFRRASRNAHCKWGRAVMMFMSQGLPACHDRQPSTW